MSFHLLPGHTIGIISNDLMGQNMAQNAHAMGFNVVGFSEYPDTPVTFEADESFIGYEQLALFKEKADIITYTAPWLAPELTDELEGTVLPQGLDLVSITGDHAVSRAFNEACGLNILPYRIATSLDEVSEAARMLGYPVVVKPIFKHKHHDETVILHGVWDLGMVAPLVDGGTMLVENWLEPVREFSVTAIRSETGDVKAFPIREIQKQAQHLRKAWTVDNLDHDLIEALQEVVIRISTALDYVGAFSVNFFFSSEENLYVRDILPGIEATDAVYEGITSISVVEQHLRAITGQPLQAVKQYGAAMYLPITARERTSVLWNWGIQDSWAISFYRHDDGIKLGHVNVLATNTVELLQNIDATQIWTNNPDTKVES